MMQREWRQPYVEAALLCGMSRWFVMRRYVWRAAATPVIALLPLIAGRAVMAIAALGFIGLSPSSPALDWGAMVAESMPYLREAPALVFIPAAAIFLSTFGLGLLAAGLGRAGRIRA